MRKQKTSTDDIIAYFRYELDLVNLEYERKLAESRNSFSLNLTILVLTVAIFSPFMPYIIEEEFIKDNYYLPIVFPLLIFVTVIVSYFVYSKIKSKNFSKFLKFKVKYEIILRFLMGVKIANPKIDLSYFEKRIREDLTSKREFLLTEEGREKRVSELIDIMDNHYGDFIENG